jgi:Uma2 family endonuclease
MDEYHADILVRHPVPRRRLTVAEYRRLGQVGILGEDDRVELLEGQLVDMSPIGPRHAIVVDELVHTLAAAVGQRAYVRGQNPVTLDSGSEPQPDIAVVKRRWIGYPNAHPGPSDIFLLIEVADSSLDTDSGAKVEVYATSGIVEFWIVDLTTDVVRVHRNPKGRAYEWVTTVKAPDMLDVEGLPGVSIAASAIFD